MENKKRICDVVAPPSDAVAPPFTTSDVEAPQFTTANLQPITNEVEAPQFTTKSDNPLGKVRLPVAEHESVSAPACYKSKPDTTKTPAPSAVPPTKWGINTVEARGVIETSIQPVSPTTCQNVVTRANHVIQNAPNHVTYLNNAYQIGSTITGPPGGEPARHGRIVSSFRRTMPVGQGLQDFPIHNTAPIEVGRIDQDELLSLVDNGIIKFRATTEALMASLNNVSRPIAEGLAPYLMQQTTVYDCSQIFVNAFLIHAALYEYGENGVVPILAQAANLPFTYANIAAPVAEAPANMVTLLNAMQNGMPTLDTDLLSAPDLCALRLIARGPNCLNVAAAARIHVSQQFTTTEIQMCLLSRQQDYAVPVFAMPTADQFLATINKLVELTGAHDSYVKGFVRAASILCGRTLHQAVAGNANTWISSTLEIVATAVPQARMTNPMWGFLGKGRKNMDRTQNFAVDYQTLRGLQGGQLVHVSVLVAAWISLGISTTLHTFNLTGREMNSLGVAAAVHRNAAALVRDLFIVASNAVNNIYPIAMGFMAQLHNANVCPSVFQGSSWCNACINFPDGAFLPAASWFLMFPHSVPYLVSPLALATGMSAYSHLWGLSQSPLKFDFSKEMIASGDNATKGWSAHLGTAGYDQKAKSQMPFIYEQYGPLALNAMRQHFGLDAAWQITYDAIERRDSGTVARSLGILEVDQPEYVAGLNYITPGTMPSYDWANNRVVAPKVTRAVMTGVVYEGLCLGAVHESRNAGLNGPFIADQPAQCNTLASILAGLNIVANPDIPINVETKN